MREYLGCVGTSIIGMIIIAVFWIIVFYAFNLLFIKPILAIILFAVLFGIMVGSILYLLTKE